MDAVSCDASTLGSLPAVSKTAFLPPMPPPPAACLRHSTSGAMQPVSCSNLAPNADEPIEPSKCGGTGTRGGAANAIGTTNETAGMGMQVTIDGRKYVVETVSSTFVFKHSEI